MKHNFFFFSIVFLMLAFKTEAKEFSCGSLFAQYQNFEFTEDILGGMFKLATSQVQTQKLPPSESKNIALREIQKQVREKAMEMGEAEQFFSAYRQMVVDVATLSKESAEIINAKNLGQRQRRIAIQEMLKKQEEIKRRQEVIRNKYRVDSIEKAVPLAAEHNAIDDIKFLVSLGINLDAVQRFGDSTALHYSVREGNFEISNLLLEAGANGNLIDRYGKTHKDYANKKILELYRTDQLGTALLIAAAKGNIQTVKFLVHYMGVDPSILSSNNETPLLLAAKNNKKDAVDFLFSAEVAILTTNLKISASEALWAKEIQNKHLSPDLVPAFLNALKDGSFRGTSEVEFMTKIFPANAGLLHRLLLEAIEHNRFKTLRYLVRHLKAQKMLGPFTDIRAALIVLATRSGNLDMVKYLVRVLGIDSKLNPEHLYITGSSVTIVEATRAAQYAIADFLLQKHAELLAAERQIDLSLATEVVKIQLKFMLKFGDKNKSYYNLLSDSNYLLKYFYDEASLYEMKTFTRAKLKIDEFLFNVYPLDKRKESIITFFEDAVASEKNISKVLALAITKIRLKYRIYDLEHVFAEALKSNNLKEIKILFKVGADINSNKFLVDDTYSRYRDIHDTSPAYYAAERGYFEILDYLISQGAKTKVGNRSVLETAVMTLAYEYEQIRRYSNYGIEYIHRALFQAIDYKNLDHIKRIIRVLPDINYAIDNQTPLMRAEDKGNKEIVDYLLMAGADIGQARKYRAVQVAEKYHARDIGSALFNAIGSKNLNDIRTLINGGVDKNIKNSGGQASTALIWAIRSNDLDIARYLVEIGADLEAKDKIGITALVYAVETNKLGFVQLLVENGADLFVKQTIDSPIIINGRHYNESSEMQAIHFATTNEIKKYLNTEMNKQKPGFFQKILNRWSR